MLFHWMLFISLTNKPPIPVLLCIKSASPHRPGGIFVFHYITNCCILEERTNTIHSQTLMISKLFLPFIKTHFLHGVMINNWVIWFSHVILGYSVNAIFYSNTCFNLAVQKGNWAIYNWWLSKIKPFKFCVRQIYNLLYSSALVMGL